MNKQDLVKEYKELVQNREQWLSISRIDDVLTNDFNRRIETAARKLEDFLDDIEFFNLTGQVKNPVFSTIENSKLINDIDNVVSYEIRTNKNLRLIVRYNLTTRTLTIEDGKINLAPHLNTNELKVVYDFLQEQMELI